MIETIFNFSNVIVMPFWILMIGFPTWRWTKRIIRSHWIALPIAVIYAGLLISSMVADGTGGVDMTLAGITRGLGHPQGAALGWAHFLTFDLLVGRWMYLDSRAKNRSPWAMAFVLIFTLMTGPIGYLLYLLLGLRDSKENS